MSEPKITITENGPLRVEGDVPLFDADGNRIQPTRPERYSLCRCGGSTNKPFCDGTHSKIGFLGANAAVQAVEEGPGPGRRDEYVRKLKLQLDEWNDRIDALEERLEDAQAGARKRYQEQRDSLMARRREAEEKLKEIQEASGNAWEELREGADRAWAQLKDAVNRARAEFEKES